MGESSKPGGRGGAVELGAPLPVAELVDHEGRPWSPARISRPTILIFHRHLA